MQNVSRLIIEQNITEQNYVLWPHAPLLDQLVINW